MLYTYLLLSLSRGPCRGPIPLDTSVISRTDLLGLAQVLWPGLPEIVPPGWLLPLIMHMIS